MERFFRKSFSYFIIIVVTYYTTVFFVIDDICIQRETKLELLGRIPEPNVIKSASDPIIGTCQSTNKKIYFLKTHKTASSVIENILMRYAWKYNKTVAS